MSKVLGDRLAVKLTTLSADVAYQFYVLSPASFSKSRGTLGG